MINKTIHYIWVGKNPKPKEVIECINSWKKFAKDFEIIEWNEDNFDISSNKYMNEAYKMQKWAFVSDYIRLKVLYQYGGVYLDTDMELIKPIDNLLHNRAFAGFEDADHIAAGIVGVEKNHLWIKDILDLYEEKSFCSPNGKIDLTPIVVHLTNITKKKYGLNDSNSTQVLKDGLIIYEKETFYPISLGEKTNNLDKAKLSGKSYSIHHYHGSWLDKKGKIKVTLRRLMGNRNVNRLKAILKLIKVRGM